MQGIRESQFSRLRLLGIYNYIGRVSPTETSRGLAGEAKDVAE